MRLGIDLGTTRTLVAASDRGNYPLVGFENEDGDVVSHLPTVVAEEGGELVYGFAAERVALEGGPHLRSFKRLLGRHGPTQEVTVGEVGVSLLDMTTGFLGYVRRMLATRSNLSAPDAIGEVVVSVPANAHSSQRFATLEAFRGAGFFVLAMLNEPSAAGIEYAHRHRGTLNNKRDHVAIYDLGGGTFDAALVMVADEHHDVIDTSGIQELGGDDFDAILLQMALDEATTTAPEQALPGLLAECRAVKEAIHPSTKRLVLELSALGDAAPAEPVILSVADYFERLRPLVDATVDALSEAIAPGGGGASVDELKEQAASAGVAGIYVVGGASALPVVARQLRERLGRRVHRSPHPAGAIAMGLAIAADEEQAPAVAERFTRHLGVFREEQGGARIRFDPIFSRGTAMPGHGEAPLIATRRYRAAHNVGHYRFVECAGVDPRGEPDGDISPHGEVRFAFAPALRDLNGALAEAPVERLAHDGPLIEERYEVDAAGVIAVTIAAVEDGYAQRFVL